MEDTFIVNGRFLTQKMTGVHRYAYEMCCALHRIGCSFLVVAPQSILADYQCPFEVRKYGRYSSHIWEQIELPRFMNKFHKDKLLITFMGLGSVLYSKSICTIHDLSYLENPAWFSKSYYYFYKILTPISAKRAIKILTVSHFTKSEIVRKLRIKEEKIEVIYGAVTENVVSKKKKQRQKQKFILSVASLDPRKNFSKLVEAYHLLNDSEYKLYIVGKKDRVFNEIVTSNWNLNNIVFTGYVTDEELTEYYRNASLFVYPSLFEGFGLPNLEAMTNECPVLTSDIPPHKEVCADAAVYFNPKDVVDIKQKIITVLNDEKLQTDMIKKGVRRALKFSFKLSAEKLLNTIKNLNNI